ncbi:hypothetical protein [Actinotalea fermentans]|uniref:PRC-barrel domain-containing protein n=1 Tax=Actinotalea fermentans TaxID=43671 RepID=A0A511Z1K3_9CELL|nr:hypothetical protein [Actinotalea fermentans]KGM16531.1 hypothetical protein N867_19160 [Actinotalea fermentans ATCC 43279 = JCM 9966 = DSM 3133]GEN81329.1 hypothetical protein AFE02nite_30630 [Actinotalea fermentans]
MNAARRRERARRRPAAPYPLDEPSTGRLLDARLHLLDRQVLDVDGTPVTVVDDVELTDPGPDDGAPRVVALLSGSVLNTRLLGGHQPGARWYRIPWSAVRRVGVTLELEVRGEELDVTWTERWLRDHLIARIPGGRHDPR